MHTYLYMYIYLSIHLSIYLSIVLSTFFFLSIKSHPSIFSLSPAHALEFR